MKKKRRQGLGLVPNVDTKDIKDIALDPFYQKLIKGVVLGGLSVAAFFVVRRVINVIKAQNTADALKKELDNSLKVGSNLTITDSQAAMYANSLWVAMEGVGTDDETINKILFGQLQTKDDWSLVIKKFGVKKYGYYGSPAWGDGTDMTLIDWLRQECSTDLLNRIEAKLTEYGIG